MTSQQKRRFSFYIESSVDSPPCSPAGTFSPKRVKGFSGMEPGRCQHIYIYIIEGSLEVKPPTIWRDEKQSRAEAQRRGRLEERRSEEKE